MLFFSILPTFNKRSVIMFATAIREMTQLFMIGMRASTTAQERSGAFYFYSKKGIHKKVYAIKLNDLPFIFL
jgi:hypothetical protein